jgi:subfamily B ATP-binding cassette protein MsbA
VILIGRRVRKAGAKEEQEAGMVMVVMQEAFAGVSVVKSHAREAYEIRKFVKANEKMLALIMRWRKAMAIVGPLVETVASFGIAAAMVYVAVSGLKASHFIALNGALVLLYPPAKTLSRMHILLQKILVAATKVFEMIETKPTIQDKKDAIQLQTRAAGITFNNLTFTYGNAKDLPAVSGINLKIESGKTYALVGASGAGKSTLLSLLLRFYDPQEGSISVNGIDLRDITQGSLRDHIGVVNQDTFLFHDSIYENIRYGRLDATREEIIEAAKHAFAHEFIEEQPNGYDTVIGDKGCLLSGGQKQRLSIARAILRNAPILLLDEAMSALDTESEKKVQAAIDQLSSGKTVIAIAHRLSTILEADQIVVMDQGRVCDVGTHSELLVKSPIYEKLYNLQYRSTEAPVSPRPDPYCAD